jgi:hypothetical protein
MIYFMAHFDLVSTITFDDTELDDASNLSAVVVGLISPPMGP